MNKSTILISSFIAVSFTAVLALVYFTHLRPQTVAPLSQTPTITPISTIAPTPTSVAISDWKTYRNEKYGYELQYPSNWKINDNSDELILSSPTPTKDYGNLGYYNDIDFLLKYYPDIKSIQSGWFEGYESIKDFFDKTTKSDQVTDYRGAKQININGATGYKFIISGHSSSFGVVFENKKGIYWIDFFSAGNESELTDEQKSILSTFKFTN